MRRSTPRALRRLIPLLLAAAAASCAPHRLAPPALDMGATAARFAISLARREALGAAVDAEVSAWVKGEAVGDLPGMHATLALSAPDAFRLRVESLFGVALDLGAHGDTLVAYVPAQRLGLTLDAVSDTLGVRAPGALGYRVLSAGFTPPPDAFQAAAMSDSLLAVSWEEGGDSLRLEVGSNGLPRRACIETPGRSRVVANYRAWSAVDGVAWPSLVEVEDGAGKLRLTLRMTRVWRNLRPVPGRLVVRIPDGANRLEWSGVRRALERAKGL